MRVKLKFNQRVILLLRITPAHAGKTELTNTQLIAE